MDYEAKNGVVWIINNVADDATMSGGIQKNEEDVEKFFRDDVNFQVLFCSKRLLK